MGSQTKLPELDFASDLAESIEVMRANVPVNGVPYYGLFSGGKDSVALKRVAQMAGVPVEWYYNVTTIDPPELVRFIRRRHPDVRQLRPRCGNLFRRAAEVKGFPTRRMRWCCSDYKERRSPRDRTLLMGIRAQESPRRAARWGGHVITHRQTKQLVVNPLLYWEAEDLWDFIRGERVPYCDLYDEGFHRLGCVGCPMAQEAGRRKEFARWPRFEKRWRWVLERVWERKSGTRQRNGRRWFGDAYFNGWEEMWDWWLSGRALPDRLVSEWPDDAPWLFEQLEGD